MLNCSQCSAYNVCTACDGDLVVNGTGDGCTGKIYYHKMWYCLVYFRLCNSLMSGLDSDIIWIQIYRRSKGYDKRYFSSGWHTLKCSII